jgi:hypothetical protein
VLQSRGKLEEGNQAAIFSRLRGFCALPRTWRKRYWATESPSSWRRGILPSREARRPVS